MKQIIAILAVAASYLSFASAQTVKVQTASVQTDRASSTLSSELSGFAPGETTWFVFEQELADGWHVYWKNPGDSGLPLEFSWSLPDGFEAGGIVYPLPERIPVGPLANFGHHGKPVFLASITAPENLTLGDTVDIELGATWLICEEICVPESGRFQLSLPVEETPRFVEDVKGRADKARLDVPAPLDGTAKFSASDSEIIVAIQSADLEALSADELDKGFFFPAKEGLIEPAAVQTIDVADGGIVVTMHGGFDLDPATLELVDGVFAFEKDGERTGIDLVAQKSNGPLVGAIGSVPAGSVSNATNLPLLLLAAFFGGIILNVMPCVFPILFIKASSLVKASAEDMATVRRHGILYTVGVVATFAALGGALLALRAGGEQLGWGFHLQSPPIVALSAFVLFLVGLNLAGVFTVGESLANTGDGLASKGGNAGAFFTGALAVVVAAPCIGPLLSAPMGAAVLLPPVAGMSIFILMALGLAAPYFLVSFVPAFARMLPRPGAWMKIFKQALAFPVFAAAAYFLWVLAQQTGSLGLARGLVGLVMVGFAAWLFELSKGDGFGAIIIRAASAIALVFSVFVVARLEIAEATVTASKGGYGAIEAVVFDPVAIRNARTNGQGVFVDFTAAWCVTCQFNKLTIFSKSSIAQAVEETDTVFMSADWTRRDPKITEALAEHGANGVPLYVYYPATGEPSVLTLPISENDVIDALKS